MAQDLFVSDPGALHIRATSPVKKATWASGKVLSKGGLAEALATETELKKKDCMRVMDSLAAVATKQVKSAGKVTIPGLCMIKTRLKPAKTIVKAYCVAALKKSV